MVAATTERPPVSLVDAAALKVHEQTIPQKLEELVAALERDGVVRKAVVVDAKTLVVLDGHHRLAALRRLGCKRVPVMLVDYLRADIRVGTWRKGEKPPDKTEVLRRAQDGKPFPPKSTRHFFPWRLHEEAFPLAGLRA